MAQIFKISLRKIFLFVLGVAYLGLAFSASSEETYIKASVQWVYDEAYADVVGGLRPSTASLSFYVYRDGRYVGSKTLSAANGWTTTFTDLPVRDPNGTPYQYTFTSLDYKAPAFLGEAIYQDGLLNIKETFRPTMKVTADFSFLEDENNYYETRPDPETSSAGDFLLYYKTLIEVKGSSFSVDESGKYTVEFEKVPTYVFESGSYRNIPSFSLKSSKIPPYLYETRGTSFDMARALLTSNFYMVSKAVDFSHKVGVYYNGNQFLNSTDVWKNAVALGLKVPYGELSAALMDGDAPAAGAKDPQISTNALSLSHTWQLPLNDTEGKPIAYSALTVDFVPDMNQNELDKRFIQTTTATESKVGSSTKTSINVMTVLPILRNNSVTLRWDDGGNFMGTREAFPLSLAENGVAAEKYGTFALSVVDGAAQNIPPMWTKIPLKDENGKNIAFSVLPEVGKPYYTHTVDRAQTQGPKGTYTEDLSSTVTMKLLSQKVTADIEWLTDGSATELNNRPQNVLLTLYTSADGGTTWQEFFGKPVYAVTAADGWHIQWDAPVCDAEGKPLLYKVEQNALSLYETSYASVYPPAVAEGSETSLTVTNKYTTVWDYDIQLSWNDPDPTRKFYAEDATYGVANITRVASLSVSVNQDYDTGKLQIRIPYALYQYRNGGVPAVEFALPQAPATNSAYAYNYTINKPNPNDPTTWEIVISNWRRVTSGTNLITTFGYTIDPYQTIDRSLGTLQAVGSGQSITQQEAVVRTSNEISYRLDTGISAGKQVKETNRPVYVGEGFDFENYNYVEYYLRDDDNRVYYNQPFRMIVDEKPLDNGEVVSISGSPVLTKNESTGLWESAILGTSKPSSSSPYYSLYRWTVLVRYPRSEGEDPQRPGSMRPDLVYHNTAYISFVAADQHEGDKGPDDRLDTETSVVAAQMPWKDYEFSYTGAIVSADKYMSLFDNYGSAMTALAYGVDVKGSGIRVTTTVNGYNFNNGYSIDLYDDAVFARATIPGQTTTPYIRLTSEDYELIPVNYASPKVQVTLRSSDIDRTNGATIKGYIPEEPFILWGRTDGGQWAQISEITMQPGTEYYYVDGDLITGYTGLRLTSPQGLQGRFEINIYCYIKLRHTSPVLQKMIADNATQISIVNISGHDMYAPDEGGQYVWVNPSADSTDSNAQVTGLNAQDLAERGSYVARRSATTSIYPANFSSAISKTTGTVVYDMANSVAKVPFTVSAYESINATGTYLKEVYEAWSANSATVYDLLPLGYRLDTSRPITVQGYRASGTSVNLPAILESYMVVSDNYQGTGRQLLKFEVRSALPPGNNWASDYSSSKTHSGFQIGFEASISYDDVLTFGSGYNIAVYQRGDLREISGGYGDDGHGRYSTPIFPAGADGGYALGDVNGDGDTATKNTLFAYALASPNPLYNTQTGIRKAVRAKNINYVRDDVSDLGANYRYKVAVETSPAGETSNIILYDILETAESKTGWKGEFVGVDYTVASLRGIDVKVYYSSSDLTYSDAADLALDSGNWKPLTDAVLPGDVKALAFDMSKLKNGEPFVLKEQSVVFAEVEMKAPDKLQLPKEYAYNAPAYSCTFKLTSASEGVDQLQVGSRTSVLLHDLQDFEFRKVYADESGQLQPLGGVEFSLYRCTADAAGHTHTGSPLSNTSCWGKAIAVQRSFSDGSVFFRDLDTGSYAIVETFAPTGFVRNTALYWTFDVDASKGTVSDPAAKATYGAAVPMEEKEGQRQLRNTRFVRSLLVSKVWTDDRNSAGIRPKQLTFDLYRNGELYQTKTVDVGTSGAASETFTNIFKDIYTYDVYGTTYQYVIKERSVPGYFPAADSVTVGTGPSVSCTNIRQGALDLVKVLPNSDTKAEFEVTLRLTDSQGVAIGGGRTLNVRRYAKQSATAYTEEEAAISADGLVTLKIHGGEKLRVLDLPLNAKYEVEEKAGNYQHSISPVQGQTAGGGPITLITITNKAKETTLTLPVKKMVEGPAPEAKAFSFKLESVTENAPMPESDTLSITGSGAGSFGAISYTAVGEYEYKLTETDGGLTGYTYDTAARTIKVIVRDNEGRLEASWTVDGEAKDQVEFTNTYAPLPVSLELPVKKTVEGPAPEAKAFSFKLEQVTENAPMPESDLLNLIGSNENSFGTISYTAVGEYEYKLTEVDGGLTGYTYDTAARTIKVIVKDNAGRLEAVWTVNGETKEEVGFTNTYKPLPVSLELPVKKTVEGPVTDSKTFSFKLESVTENAPMPEEETLSITGSRAGGFGAISYTAVGEYEYKLTETDGGLTGYTYDTEARTIKVIVKDNAGRLEASWTVDGEAKDQVEFTNIYEPLPVSLELPVKKTVEGPAPEAKAFSFKLEQVTENAPMPESDLLNLIGSNENSFGTISYTAVGEYEYKLTEADGGLTGYTYDTAARTIKVIVKDNAGRLEASWTVDGEAKDQVEFTNTYEPLPVSFKLPVKKMVEGPAPESKAFSFKLEQVTENAPMPESDTLSITGSGAGSFGAISYTAVGEYEYKLTETDGGLTGYTYDTEARTIKVIVRDNAGRLEAVWTVNGETKEQVGFTNTYEKPTPEPTAEPTATPAPTPPAQTEPPTPSYPTIKVPLAVKKELVNGSLKGGEFTFLLKDRNGKLIASAQNAADGTVNFPERTFSKEVSNWTYTIREEAGKESGISYDSTVYTVKVSTKAVNGELSATVNIEKDGTPYAGEMVFVNRKAMPKTGDSAYRTAGLLAGMALLLGAGAYLMEKKRRTSR